MADNLKSEQSADDVRELADRLMTIVHGREHSYETVWHFCDHPFCKEAQAILRTHSDGDAGAC